MIPAGLFSNIGRGLMGAGARALGSNQTALGALIGGAMGGYSALGTDRSMIGNILGGAFLGAGAARYGGAAIRGGAGSWNTAAGLFAGGNTGGAARLLARRSSSAIGRATINDMSRIGMASNKALNGFTGFARNYIPRMSGP